MSVFKKLLTNVRLMVQIGFTAITNGYLIGFTEGKIYKGSTKQICVPGLNCYSCPGAIGSCPIGSLQAVIGSKNFKFSFYIIGFLMIIGTTIGRFACGWLCPFGLVQDLLYRIPSKKIKKVPFDKYLRYLKFVILGVFVFGMPLLIRGDSGYGSPWFCKLICPSGTLLAGIPLVTMNPSLQRITGFLFNWKISILIITLLGSIFIYRPFCKYVCPLGAIYGVFNIFSLYGYKVDENICNKCGICERKCKMNVKVYENPNSIECIRCGECIKNCPRKAIDSVFLKEDKSSKKYKEAERSSSVKL